jgi:hypothetical protein
MAWRNRLPDLESAALFKVLHRDLIFPYERRGKLRYECAEEESDARASLFSYDENNKWRFKNGNHIWSETHDRNFSDLFALQDEITMAVMAVLNVQITGYATGALKYSRPTSLKAYEHCLRGLYYHLGRRPGDVQKARRSFEEAIQIDPNFGRAYTWLANT